ncbi:hypothetical protein AAE478_004232 [Parahypoxylon ruwenzoriense]
MFNNMDSFHGFSNMGDDWQKNTTWSNGFSQAAYNNSSTFSVINQFKFLAARSIRTSTIILAAFNTVSAFATAVGIFYDCYTTAKRSNRGGKGRVNIFRCIQGPETYPFILSLGITIQGIVFAVAQSRGLDRLFAPGCSLVSQFMWPAVFIVPYIQLVLGLEVTFRALKRSPFPPRGKWNIAICLAIIKLLLTITGLVGFFIRPPNFCFASLFWFVAKWAEGGFVLLVAIVVVLTLCTVIIFMKLTRYSIIETSERVSASRMVYYLALAVITNALIAPFFIYLTISDPMDDNGGPGLTLSMIATVVANVTGLTTGGLYLFLRSNTIATISPKNKHAEYERQKLKHQIRVRGANDISFNGHILQPVSGPQYFSKTESQESLMGDKSYFAERGEGVFRVDPNDPNPLRSNAVFDAIYIPRAPEPAQISATPLNTHSRKPSASYNLFPSKNQSNTTSDALLQPTAYIPNPQPNPAPTSTPFRDVNDTLKPPPTVRSSWNRHRRESSLASSATVQIGLRLSNIADIGPISKVTTEIGRVHTLGCPKREEMGNNPRPSPLITYGAPTGTPSQSSTPSSDTTMKNLPPVPARPEKEENCTLNPTVYDPNSPTKVKTPSPRGVGFNVPRRVNTTPVDGMPVRSSSRDRGNSSSAAENRADWI